MRTFLAVILIILIGYTLSYVAFVIDPIPHKVWIQIPTMLFTVAGYVIGSVFLIYYGNILDEDKLKT